MALYEVFAADGRLRRTKVSKLNHDYGSGAKANSS